MIKYITYVYDIVCMYVCVHRYCTFIYRVLYFSSFILVSTPWIAPLLEPLLRMSGAFGSLPRVTEAAIKMVEMRRKEGDGTSVSSV